MGPYRGPAGQLRKEGANTHIHDCQPASVAQRGGSIVWRVFEKNFGFSLAFCLARVAAGQVLPEAGLKQFYKIGSKIPVERDVTEK